jgi:hypothetical protein
MAVPLSRMVRHAGFAVVTEFGILKSGPLPPNISAQLAELVALTEALRLSKEQSKHLYSLPDPACSCSHLEEKRNVN